MRARKIAVSLLLVTVVLFNFSCVDQNGSATATKTPDQPRTVFQTVEKNRVLRAAYITYPPAVIRDPQTKKLTGVFVETLERAAEDLGWKVVWTEEVGWGSQIEGLQSGRYDIIGSPVWANAQRARLTTLSKPVYYSGIGVYVRKGDKRFLKSLAAINSPDVRISTIDGETGDLIARRQFPLAKRVSLTQLSDISEELLQIQTGKADVAFVEAFLGEQFSKKNPNAVTNIAAKMPIKTLGNCYMVKAGEPQLKQALDVVIEDLQNSGYVDELLAKYEPAPNSFYRVAQPYRVISVPATTANR